MFEYHHFKIGATDRQKKMISTFHTPKRKGRTGTSFDKKKYWCETEQTGYLATKSHYRCPLCYKYNGKDDRHKITPFDEKKGHIW